MAQIEVGQEAPDFTLPNQDKKEIKLSDLRGKNVVLAFYPLDWSPVCTKENECFRDDLPRFEGAEIYGISIDSVWSHKAFREKLGLKYDLLADMKRDVVKKYGLYLEEANIGKRATVVVDKQGKVAYFKEQPMTEARDNAEIVKVLESLK